MKNAELRAQVINHMADVAKRALDEGEDGLAAIERAFPGTPVEVATTAWLRAEDEKTEEWWQAVERTIDVETVARAITKVNSES